MMAGQWTEIGPVDVPIGTNVRALGAGRLHFLEFDDMNNRILCGSPSGGLFFSEDNGQTWKLGGMDYLPVIGVSHAQVAKHTNGGKTWFVATGDGDDPEWERSNGIWRTTDKGATWDDIGKNNALGVGFGDALCRRF